MRWRLGVFGAALVGPALQLSGPDAAGAASRTAVADTVVAVAVGDRLEVTRLQGDLRIVGWEAEDRVQLEQISGDPMALRRQDGVVHLETSRDPDAEVILRVPRGMRIVVRSRDLDLALVALDGSSEVDLLDGGIEVRQGGGRHVVRLADGDVELRELTGSADLLVLDGDVRVTGGSASLAIEVTDGDLSLRPERVGATLTASTLDGDVSLRGAIPERSRVELSTHDGDVTLTLDPGQGGRFAVAVWDGSFASDAPARTSRVRPGEPVQFLVGDAENAASIRLTSFDGDIRIRRVP